MLNKINPHSYAAAAFIPAAISWLLTALSVFLLKDYGLGVFILVPLFIGIGSTILYGYGSTKRTSSFFSVASMSLAIYCIGLVLFAMEGAICIVMAAPLGFIISFIGVLIGELIVKSKKSSPVSIITGFAIVIPAVMGFETISNEEDDLHAVTTSIIINKPPAEVWEKVVRFSKIDEPKEWLFSAGIAYPTHAEIKKSGNRLIRYCNFSTGSFVEPITKWDEPNLLAFSVEETPEPLKEISPYDIEPAHLHGYFVSKNGQFRLIALPGGRTRLEGTTWYIHKIKPGFYWQVWSNYIIHQIHNRVLGHIKKETEATVAQ